MRLGRIYVAARLVLEGERARVLRLVNSESRECIERIRTSPEPQFFLDAKQTGAIVSSFRGQFGERTESIILDADAIVSHHFSFLGAYNVDLGETIDWHRDFKSGIRWSPRTYFKLVGKVRKHTGADPKIPWELSRFQHVPTLGKAYWFTNDERYALEFVDQLSDWMTSNPCGFGINWACPMDVAIRVANWAWGWYCFKDSPSISDRFVARFLTSVAQHGRHIANNLEVVTFEGKSYKNNHYLSDIVGLVYLGILFPELGDAKEWRSIGIRGLEEEMRNQVEDDGASFEVSIPYHRLALELFLYPTLLCRVNGIELSGEFHAKLERMLEFTAGYTKPDGHAPQMGDADDGRLHILSDYATWDRRDHRYLLEIGAALFGRQDFRDAAGGEWEEAYWLTRPLEMGGATPIAATRTRDSFDGSAAFKSSGFYIMKSGDHYAIINATEVGTGGLGAHKHCDVFSLELCIGDSTFIADPGSYLYTPQPEQRDLFRSTAYHSTVHVDGNEQNRFDASNLFLMREEAKPHIHTWESNSTFDYFDAEHYGYCRFPNPIVHRRKVYFDKENLFWIVKDELMAPEHDAVLDHQNRATAAGIHAFVQHLHFAPIDVSFEERECDLPLTAREALVSRFAIDEESLSSDWAIVAKAREDHQLVCVPLLTEGIEREMLDGSISSGYGRKETAPIVRMTKKERRAEFLNVFSLKPAR